MTKAKVFDCEALAENMESYMEKTISLADAQAFEAHMNSCDACRKAVHYSRAVGGLIDYVDAKPQRASASAAARAAVRVNASEAVAEAPRGSLTERLGGAPWWMVSCALHVLVIALASLVSMAIELPRNDDAVIMVTELQAQQTLKDDQAEQPKPSLQDVMARNDVPATDKDSKEVSDIVIPPDILAKAEVGDHFETINLDRPDTHSAYGNEDARSFHSVSGNAEAAGGGGTGGIGMEDVIGVGGAASKGTGGGFGGGDGTGTGVQSGAGHGSFGNRNGGGRKLMVKRFGGSKATESAVDKALQWLAYHQEADGHWDTVKHKAGGKVDTAMTSLAILAFLGAGHTEKIGQYKDNVVRGVNWLKGIQDQKTGSIYDKGDNFDGCSLGYSEAMAAMALAEATGMARIPETKAAAQKAIEYCTDTFQQGEGSDKLGWRYSPKSVGDLSNGGWFVMAMKSAKVAGLHVNPASFEGAAKFIDSCEMKNEGPDTGYGPASRFAYQPGVVKSKFRNSAMGILCRLFMGAEKEKLQSSVDLMVADGGTPKRGQWTTDLYYWYYGSLITFQTGGDTWKKWNEDMKASLLDAQCKNGDDAGSWDPAGAYSEAWGRVGQTALSALCMEVYYRYAKLGEH